MKKLWMIKHLAKAAANNDLIMSQSFVWAHYAYEALDIFNKKVDTKMGDWDGWSYAKIEDVYPIRPINKQHGKEESGTALICACAACLAEVQAGHV